MTIGNNLLKDTLDPGIKEIFKTTGKGRRIQRKHTSLGKFSMILLESLQLRKVTWIKRA
jgi:hypothetical protein